MHWIAGCNMTWLSLCWLEKNPKSEKLKIDNCNLLQRPAEFFVLACLAETKLHSYGTIGIYWRLADRCINANV